MAMYVVKEAQKRQCTWLRNRMYVVKKGPKTAMYVVKISVFLTTYIDQKRPNVRG